MILVAVVVTSRPRADAERLKMRAGARSSSVSDRAAFVEPGVTEVPRTSVPRTSGRTVEDRWFGRSWRFGRRLRTRSRRLCVSVAWPGGGRWVLRGRSWPLSRPMLPRGCGRGMNKRGVSRQVGRQSKPGVARGGVVQIAGLPRRLERSVLGGDHGGPNQTRRGEERQAARFLQHHDR